MLETEADEEVGNMTIMRRKKKKKKKKVKQDGLAYGSDENARDNDALRTEAEQIEIQNEFELPVDDAEVPETGGNVSNPDVDAMQDDFGMTALRENHRRLMENQSPGSDPLDESEMTSMVGNTLSRQDPSHQRNNQNSNTTSISPDRGQSPFSTKPVQKAEEKEEDYADDFHDSSVLDKSVSNTRMPASMPSHPEPIKSVQTSKPSLLNKSRPTANNSNVEHEISQNHEDVINMLNGPNKVSYGDLKSQATAKPTFQTKINSEIQKFKTDLDNPTALSNAGLKATSGAHKSNLTSF